MKKNKKQRNEQPWTLAYTSILLKLSFKLFFLSRPIGFPSKMMPCKQNHNLICLCHGPLFKGLGTNLKLLTTRNVQFHWTLVPGPLSTMALLLFYFSQISFSIGFFPNSPPPPKIYRFFFTSSNISQHSKKCAKK